MCMCVCVTQREEKKKIRKNVRFYCAPELVPSELFDLTRWIMELAWYDGYCTNVSISVFRHES